MQANLKVASICDSGRSGSAILLQVFGSLEHRRSVGELAYIKVETLSTTDFCLTRDVPNMQVVERGDGRSIPRDGLRQR
jgi:hypothetical protein